MTVTAEDLDPALAALSADSSTSAATSTPPGDSE
jgi:hypothetical protein